MWFFPALLSAVIDSAEKNVAKKRTEKYSEFLIVWLPAAVTLLVMLPLLFVAEIPMTLSSTFWAVVIVRGALDAVSRVLLIRAFTKGDLSLTFPILSFTPVFLVVIEWFATGDLPSGSGFLGIISIVTGVFLLQTVGTGSYSWKALKAQGLSSGVALMLGVSFLHAVTSTLHRFGIAESTVILYTVLSQMSILFFLTVFGFRFLYNKRSLLLQSQTYKDLAPLGAMAAAAVLAQFYAQSLTLASYVIATKRSSIVFSALGAGVFLKEKIGRRLFPILLIFFGIVCMAFSN